MRRRMKMIIDGAVNMCYMWQRKEKPKQHRGELSVPPFGLRQKRLSHNAATFMEKWAICIIV